MSEQRNEEMESNPPIFGVKYLRKEQLVHLELMWLAWEEALQLGETFWGDFIQSIY